MCIVFGLRQQLKIFGKLIIAWKEHVKYASSVTYLGCIPDAATSSESMALEILSMINSKLSFLYRKNNF